MSLCCGTTIATKECQQRKENLHVKQGDENRPRSEMWTVTGFLFWRRGKTLEKRRLSCFRYSSMFCIVTTELSSRTINRRTMCILLLFLAEGFKDILLNAHPGNCYKRMNIIQNCPCLATRTSPIFQKDFLANSISNYPVTSSLIKPVLSIKDLAGTSFGAIIGRSPSLEESH